MRRSQCLAEVGTTQNVFKVQQDEKKTSNKDIFFITAWKEKKIANSCTEKCSTQGKGQ